MQQPFGVRAKSDKKRAMGEIVFLMDRKYNNAKFKMMFDPGNIS